MMVTLGYPIDLISMSNSAFLNDLTSRLRDQNRLIYLSNHAWNNAWNALRVPTFRTSDNSIRREIMFSRGESREA